MPFCFDCFTGGVRSCKLHCWKKGLKLDPNAILPNVNKSVIHFGKNSSIQNETRKVDDSIQIAKDLKKARVSLQKLEIEVSVLKDETKKKDFEMEKLKNENKNLKIELSRQQNLFYKKMFMCPLCEIRGWTEEEVSDHLKNFHKVSHDAQKKKNLKIECV